MSGGGDLPIQGRITNKAGRGDKPRYIRPVERQRMRPWLIAHLDSNDIAGLTWQNRREKVFRISWKHAANQCFNMQKDTNLFERWAIHTGRHQDSDHKRWKANFRCALNSLPDVVEHKDQGIKKGNNAFKVYRFLDDKETKMHKEVKGRRKKEPPDLDPEDTGYRDHSYSYAEHDGEEDDVKPVEMPRIQGLALSSGLARLRDTERLRPLQQPGCRDDPNLQEILAAATASLAAGSDAVSLEKISIEQLSRLGELSRMKLEIPHDIAPSDSHMYAYLCSWCDKVFPEKIEIFKHFLMAHQRALLARETYTPVPGCEGCETPDPSDPGYQRLQKEIEDLEKEVFSFTRDTFQSPADDVEGEIIAITSVSDAENQALDLSVKAKEPGDQSTKQDVALDLSMNSSKRHKSPKTIQPKLSTKRRRSSLEIDYTVKFGNYGLAGMPRTKRQMSLHTRKKEEEEEKLAKKMSAEVDVDNTEASGKHSVEDLVHAEILMSLKSGAGDEAESSTDSTSSKSKKDAGKGGKRGKAAQKKHLMNLEKVIEDVAKRGAKEDEDDEGTDKKSDTKMKFRAFRCGLCLQRFNDSAVLNAHVKEHQRAEKASPIIRLKLDPPAERPGFMYYRQLTSGKVQTIWKCQIASTAGPSNIYVCGVCQMKFDNLAAIYEHEKVHSQNTEESEEKIEVLEKKEQENEDEIAVKVLKDTEEEIEETCIKVSDMEKDGNEKLGGDDTSSSPSFPLPALPVSHVESEEYTDEVRECNTNKAADAVDGDVEEVSESEPAPQIIVEIADDSQTVVEEIMEVTEDLNNTVNPVESEGVTNEVTETGIEENTGVQVDMTDVELETEAGNNKADVEVVTETEKKDTEDVTADKAKVLQCNVPTFLEVSSSAEGYGIEEAAEGEKKPDGDEDKKAAAPLIVNCGICDKKLTMHEVKAHLEAHEADKDHEGKLFEPCIICKKMIPTKDGNEHLKSHSVFELSLAKNILVHNQNQLKKQLVVHKKKESEVKVSKGDSIKMFVCNLCNKGFEDCSPLAEHVKQHLKTEDDTAVKKNDTKAEKDGDVAVEVKVATDSVSDVQEAGRRKKRKSPKPDDSVDVKKAKLAEGSGTETSGDAATDGSSGSKKQAVGAIESDPKKNSLLAAALSSAPKYGKDLPRTLLVSSTTDTTLVATATTADTDKAEAGTGTVENTEAGPATSLPADTSSALTTTADLPMASLLTSLSQSGSVTSTSSDTQVTAVGSNGVVGETDSAALRDSLCLKFPLVLLKPGADTSEGSKQDNTIPVVLVRQENQELKLVPVSSVLGLGACGKTSDSATPFLKLASSGPTAAVKKSVGDSLPGVVPASKPPILYAPLSTGKSVGTAPSPSINRLVTSASPFPISLFANKSVKSVTEGTMPVEQMVADPGLVAIPIKRSGSDGRVLTVDGAAVITGQKESITESQNIIAKLLDAKTKLASQAGSLLQPQKQTQQAGSLLQPQKPAQQTGSLVQVKPQLEAQKPAVQTSVQGPVLTNMQGPVQPGLQGLARIKPADSLPVSSPGPTATGQGSGQYTPLFVFKRTSKLANVDATLSAKQSGDDATTVSIAATSAEKNLASVPPAKLGRPPIHGNKSLLVPTTQVTMTTKPKVISPGSVTPAHLSQVDVSQSSLSAVKQQQTIPLSMVATTTSTLSPGLQLQPSLVNMMIQQFLSQAGQSAGSPLTTTSLVTSPKPTFNLVFAPQAVSVAASVPSVTTVSPAGSRVPATANSPAGSQAPGTSRGSATTPPLLLMCKVCNQALDSLGRMGTHVCPGATHTLTTCTQAPPSKAASSQTTPPAGQQQVRVTVYRCNMCKGITFTEYEKYIQHVNYHVEKTRREKRGKTVTGAHTPLLVCPLCRELCHTEEAMTKHMGKTHPEGSIKCKYCKHMCVGKVDYELHVLFEHPWQCNKCYHRFSTLTLLTSHVNLDLKSLPTLMCNTCGLCFPSVESLVTHMWACHPEGEPRLNCTDPDTLNAYLEKSNSKCFCTCKTCDAGFTTPDSMMNHVQKVHFTKVVFFCGVCSESKRMTVRASLDAHQHFSGVSQHDIEFCYQCCLLFPNKALHSKHMGVHHCLVTDSTKSKLKSVLKDKVKGGEAETAKPETGEGVAETSQSETGEGDAKTSKQEVGEIDFTSGGKLVKKDDTGANTTMSSSTLAMLSLYDNIASVDDVIVETQTVEYATEPVSNTKTNTEIIKTDSEIIKIDSEIIQTDTEMIDIAEECVISAEDDLDTVAETGIVDEGLRCSQCNVGPFRSRYQLKQHVVIKHLYPRNRTSTSYYQHVVDTLKRPKVFECGKCQRKFERQSSLLRHQLTHGARRYTCKFSDCRLQFSTLAALKIHQNKCHQRPRRTGTGKVAGDDSEKKFQGGAGLPHVVRAAAATSAIVGHVANLYICKLCKVECENLSGLKQHIVDQHGSELSRCNKCGGVFIPDSDGQEHSCSRDNKTGDRKTVKTPVEGKKRRLYSCNMCNKSFFKLMKLTKHVWEHEQTNRNTSETKSDITNGASASKKDVFTGAEKETTDINEQLGSESKTDNVEQVESCERSAVGADVATGWYRCSVCKTVFAESADLFRHVKSHLSPTSAASLARTKLLHAQSVRGDPSQAPSGSMGGAEKGEEPQDAVMCDMCERIMYMGEGGLCEMALNHVCTGL